jgi:hypothetical protein
MSKSKLEKWKIAIPAIISLLSLAFNGFQYIDNRRMEVENIDLVNKLDSTNVALKILELQEKYPSFNFS